MGRARPKEPGEGGKKGRGRDQVRKRMQTQRAGILICRATWNLQPRRWGDIEVCSDKKEDEDET